MKTKFLTLAILGLAATGWAQSYSPVTLLSAVTISNSTAYATKPIIDVRHQRDLCIEVTMQGDSAGTNVPLVLYMERGIDQTKFDPAILATITFGSGTNPGTTNVWLTNVIASSTTPIPYGFIRVACSNSAQYGNLTNLSLRYPRKTQ